MSLASRVARHERQRRVRKKIWDRRRLRVVDPGDPGPFADFVTTTSPHLRRPDHLPELVDAIERGARFEGPPIRECFSYPVRHAKTTTALHAIPYILRVDPSRAILYVTFAHGFSRKQTAKAKELAVRSGVVLGDSRRKDEWTTRAGGFVKGVGIGGQLTGEGFTDVIVDDLHKNRAEAESRIIREGAIEALFNDVMTRRDPRGFNVWVLGARWHVNDVTGVLTRMENHPFKRNNRPALDQAGNPLAPWLFTRKQLEEIRETLGPYVWASLYQGDPRPLGGSLFHEPTYSMDRRIPRNFRTNIGIDLAWSTHTRADYNAAVVLRKDLDRGTFGMLEAYRVRGSIADRPTDHIGIDATFAQNLVRLLLEHPEATLWMYAGENELPLVSLLERVLRDLAPELGRRARVNTIPITKDKHMRAIPYARSWNAGLVWIPGRTGVSIGEGKARREAPHLETEEQDEWRNRDGWQNACVSEHLDFKGLRGEENDQVDAAVAAHDGHESGGGKTSMADAMRSVGRTR